MTRSAEAPQFRPRRGRTALGLALVALLYVLGLVWADRRSGALAGWQQVVAMLWLPMVLSVPFGLLRFLRWQALLTLAGYRLPAGLSLVCYLAGFAFTATPGKVGELIRIRYLAQLGVPSGRVLSASVFERLCDLFAVLLLALPAAAGQPGTFLSAMLFVFSIAIACAVAARRPQWLRALAGRLQPWRRPGALAARLLDWLAGGFAGLTQWTRPGIIAAGFMVSLLAWTLNSAILVVILQALDVSLPTALMWSLLPLAILVGAASMIPGGIGSTELVIVTVLAAHGVDLPTAVLAAVAMRLCTLWLWIALGFIAMGWLERRTLMVPAGQPDGA